MGYAQCLVNPPTMHRSPAAQATLRPFEVLVLPSRYGCKEHAQRASKTAKRRTKPKAPPTTLGA